MAFFDDIGNALSHAGQNVVQKTKDTAEVVRLNGAISEEEQRIQTLYSEIGKRYFELHANDYESALEEMVLGIKGANTKITQYRDQVMKLRGVIYCTGCHAEILVNVACRWRKMPYSAPTVAPRRSLPPPPVPAAAAPLPRARYFAPDAEPKCNPIILKEGCFYGRILHQMLHRTERGRPVPRLRTP